MTNLTDLINARKTADVLQSRNGCKHQVGEWSEAGLAHIKKLEVADRWEVGEPFIYLDYRYLPAFEARDGIAPLCAIYPVDLLRVDKRLENVPLNCVIPISTTNATNNAVPVLDRGWVELQDVMGDDLAIVNAARTSFLGETKGEDKDKKLLLYLMEHHHDSPFEMVEFKFRLHAPEVVWRQLLRHRSGNFNLQSGRYTEYLENEFYVPEHWRGQSSSNKQGSEGLLNQEDSDELNRLLQMHYETSYLFYQKAIAMGAAREIARLFLPGFGVYSTGIVKFDARNLMHFLSLRTAEDAQWEIRQYALVMWDMFEAHLPWCAEAYQKFRVAK